MSERTLEFELLGETLPPDAIAFAYEVEEGVSIPYTITVDFATLDGEFRPEKCLREGLTLRLWEKRDGAATAQRFFAGVVDACSFVHHDGSRFLFQARIVSPIAALRHRNDCRIYQDKSITDVVKEVLEKAGVSDVEWKLTGTYPKREYIVQYRESELDFVHRLLEDEGIFYFFRHDAGTTQMVLADSNEALLEEAERPVVLALTQGTPGTEPASGLSFTRKLSTSTVTLRDFDFKKPVDLPTATKPGPDALPRPYFEYPGGFAEGLDGERRSAARLRELRSQALMLRGKSGSPLLEVAKSFSVVGAAQGAMNGKFVVLGLKSKGKVGAAAEGEAEKKQVENEFSAQPEGAPFAPPRTTQKPRIRGVQTAIVTGPTQGEEEIHTDEFGRIKVRFRWDRVGQYDDKSSCWLRVAQAPLGGQVIIPRVGWEVMVAFLDGDPDKPLVLGRLYNAERTPPYALPATKTSGALKSASSPGGAGANELNFGDSGGGQGFGVTAQKDFNTTVGADQNETVGANEKNIIKVNAANSVGGDQTVTVGGNQEFNVGALHTEKVAGDLSISIGGNFVDNATSNFIDKVGADRSYTVGGNMTVICNTVKQTVDASMARDVGAVMLTGSIAGIADTCGGDLSETVSVAKLDFCKGSWAETITGARSATMAAAELNVVKGSFVSSSDASITNLVGGLHYNKIDGDFSVKAPMITLVGATGTLKGGSSQVKLGGGPITIKGSKVAIESALIVKLGTSLKLG